MSCQKEIRIKTEMINKAARDAGMTPEKFIGRMRSISLGRAVCAHYSRTEGPVSVFVCQ